MSRNCDEWKKIFFRKSFAYILPMERTIIDDKNDLIIAKNKLENNFIFLFYL